MIDDNFLRLYFEQMVEAVGTIHESKIVHSDLKPANFLFVEGALKLIDFGIAKQARERPPCIHPPRSISVLVHGRVEASRSNKNE